MKENNYSNLIKELRKERKWTQSDLASGICSQATISKIEKGLLIPDIDTLAAIAQKLETTVSTLLGETGVQSQFQKQVLHFLELREYKQLQQFLMEQDFFNTDKDFMDPYQLWLSAVLISQLDGDFQTALSLIEKALHKLAKEKFASDSLKINLYNSKANVLANMAEFEPSLSCLEKSLSIINNTSENIHLNRIISTYFLLSRTHHLLGNYSDSIFYNQTAINLCRKHESLYYLDDLFCTLANTYYATHQFEKALDTIKTAEILAIFKNNTQLLPYIERTKIKILSATESK